MSLGALTTTFGPHSSCISSFDHIYGISTGDQFYLIAGPASPDACFPDFYQPHRTAFYSPGICPSGYTAACSDISTTADSFSSLFSETVITCCPLSPSFICSTDVPSGADVWISTLGCVMSTSSIFSSATVTFTGGVSSVITTSLPSEYSINAYSVQVRLRDSDFHSTTSDTEPPSTSLATSPALLPSPGTSQPTETEASTSGTDSTGNTGLSPGAYAGIGVAATIGGLILLAAAFFLGRRSLRASQVRKHGVLPSHHPQLSHHAQPLHHTQPSHHDEPFHQKPRMEHHFHETTEVEVPSRQLVELPGPPPRELP